jgi:hypothetical protein
MSAPDLIVQKISINRAGGLIEAAPPKQLSFGAEI